MEYVPRFINSLQFQDDGGLPFTLLQNLTYVSNILVTKPSGIKEPMATFVVPAGFKTDLASIPQILWNILPPFGRYDAAAVVHDYLYQHNGVTRGEADAILHEAMHVLRVGRAKRWAIYYGVRATGWVTWNRYRGAK